MTAAHAETAMIFHCEGVELLGILHAGAPDATRGVLIVVGGPQYRVGSHRQFVLLARNLAQAGIPVLRFDYRGMGDADGEFSSFENIAPDITSALDIFCQHVPSLRKIVIWGLCDAASAALFQAWRDPRVTGLVLLNPWARTEEGQARAYLRHYYLTRLFNPELWGKIRRREFAWRVAWRSLLAQITQVWSSCWSELTKGATVKTQKGMQHFFKRQSLPERMADDWQRFQGPVLLILSGDDLTAAEFRDMAKASRRWRHLLAQSRVTIRAYAKANQTFSRREWRDQVAEWTQEWLRQC